MPAHRREPAPRRSLSSRAAFDLVATELGELARDPRCPRLPDEAWNALLRGQVTSDEGELDRCAHTLRAHIGRLNVAVLMS